MIKEIVAVLMFLVCSGCINFDPTINDGNKVELSSSIVAWLEPNLSRYEQLSRQEKINLLQIKPKYNIYVIRDLSRAYYISGDERYKEISIELFDLYVTTFIDRGILRSDFYYKKGYWYRDPFARDMFFLLQSFYYLDEYQPMLLMVESQVKKWLELVPRKYHREHNVFPYGINTNSLEVLNYQLNPNQNVAVARLFSELYFLPSSVYFKNMLFKDIVFNEVNAALSLMDERGRLSLAEHRPLVMDTNYAGYTSGMLYYVSQQWGGEWDEAVASIGSWLYEEWPKDKPWNISSDAPNYREDRFNSYNLIARIPAFFSAGVSSKYAKEWVHFVKGRFPDDKLRLESRWMDHLSIPVEYFLGKKLLFGMPPKVFISNAYPDTVIVQVVAESFEDLKVLLNNTPVLEGHYLSCGDFSVYIDGYYYFENIECDDVDIVIKINSR